VEIGLSRFILSKYEGTIMTTDDFFKALITSVLGLLPITVSVLSSWLQKRSKVAKRDAAIDFAQRRVAFLSAWLQARQLSETNREISTIKKAVADELDGIKAGVDTSMQNTIEETKKGTELPLSILPLSMLSRVIGVGDISLPFIVLLGTRQVLSSISAAYFTPVQSAYVGFLFVIGVCLLLYQGQDLIEKVGGYLGGISAIGMALFPTACDFCTMDSRALLHLVFFSLFFLTMGFLPLYWSTRIPESGVSKQQRQRNQIYKVCGFLILACTLVTGSSSVLFRGFVPVFWLEFIAFLASGVSWLTRGKWIDVR
jgi:hypothetical protein